MMNTLDLLLNRKTIRKYTKKPIDEELLNVILEAGIRGSNTGNMQLYSIVVTTDEERKKQLSAFHFGQKMIQEAPVVLTICADVNRFHQWCELREAGKAYDNFLWFLCGTIDAVIVSQNICVAAESKGLGICYLGTVNFNAPEIAEFLSLPNGVVPITTLTIGYPDENPEMVDRIPLEGVIHREVYHHYSPQDIEHIYEEKENLPFSKELVKENKTQNLAQIFTQKRYTQVDNIRVSEKLLDYLKKTGFIK